MSKGYVYILSNEHMPGLVKIGRTTRLAQQRADELYQTGVPGPFRVEYDVFSPNCEELEAFVHSALTENRVSMVREFFAVSRQEAQCVVERQLHRQMHEIVSEFLPDHEIVHSDLCVSPPDIFVLAESLGEPDPIIASALSEVSADELKPAINRVYAKIEARKKAASEF